MISNNQTKFIKSLQLKKYRKQEQCFIVEGAKGVNDLLAADFELVLLVATAAYAQANEAKFKKWSALLVTVSETKLAQLGTFQSNVKVLAVARQKSNDLPLLAEHEFALVLDDIRDPGNMGTILRTADWYGIQAVIASEQSADFYNPKVINASMGSFTRVRVGYTSLPDYLLKAGRPVYGAFAEGEPVYNTHFASSGLIVIGNESQGISPTVRKLVEHRIGIPGTGRVESLNAAVAAGIILDNWFRLKQ